MAESLALAVRVPIIVCLVVSVVLIEGVVEVAVEPEELGNNTEVDRHLGVVIPVVVVAGSDRVKSLVEVRIYNFVAEIVVGLLPEVLGEVGRVEVDRCHDLYYYNSINKLNKMNK